MEPFDNNKENLSLTRRSHWALVRNVFGALARFKSHEVKEASINEIINEIRQIPTDREYQLNKSKTYENSAFSTAIKDLRREMSFMQCVERGHLEDLSQIKVELLNDPYKILRNSNHPFALINKRNKDGLTPLYIACRNGNYEVVKCLLDEEADYLITSQVGNEEESNLEVAVRWSHTKIVKELMSKKWPKSVIKKAKKICSNHEIRDLLYLNKKRKKWFCFCGKGKD